ncbi:MAG: bifunctional protein-serine/threonine kinase/phosphatase [Burkholderiaceae bacterium]
MADTLRVRIGQHSDKGHKEINQDFHGACIPTGPALASKGVALALADGIGSSDVSHIASAAAVHALLQDYYCTSDAWSVRRSAQCVLAATNSWLHAQTRQGPHRFDADRGHVCTLSALVLKSATAHLFHVGDARIYRVQGKALEQLTQDHRVQLPGGHSHLARAMGFHPQLDIDYRALPLERGDTFVLATDGVHEHVPASFIIQMLQDHAGDLDQAARAIVAEALHRGSPDNLTLQVVRIDALPLQDSSELQRQRAALRLPPVLAPRDTLDGYQIVRELHASHRSHLYLATAPDTGEQVVLKTPSIDLQSDEDALDRFLLEEWIARRIHSPHVLRAVAGTHRREHLFVALEHVQGQTLAQWMIDHPRPALAEVRDIVVQVARGLQAFHRMEMLHQDLRPENIMIDHTGTVKIIDFGAVHVAGLAETAVHGGSAAILGTVQYTAPEYFWGGPGTPQSDLFSLGVITYQMLTGRLPYGTQVAGLRTRTALSRLRYASALHDESRPIPAWIDAVLERAVHPNPLKRQAELSEFVHELHQPGAATLARARPPLAERNPLMFWRTTALVLAITVVALLGLLHRQG